MAVNKNLKERLLQELNRGIQTVDELAAGLEVTRRSVFRALVPLQEDDLIWRFYSEEAEEVFYRLTKAGRRAVINYTKAKWRKK